jgi:hypothetical protein
MLPHPAQHIFPIVNSKLLQYSDFGTEPEPAREILKKKRRLNKLKGIPYMKNEHKREALLGKR